MTPRSGVSIGSWPFGRRIFGGRESDPVLLGICLYVDRSAILHETRIAC